MQLRQVLIMTALATGTSLMTAPRIDAAAGVDTQAFECLMQLFSDSDHVGVRSAITDYTVTLAEGSTLNLHWNNERVSVPAIAAAPGTQEAIDAITTASRPIAGNAYQDFTKLRNEFQGEMTRGSARFSYYNSQETDYVGQQIAAGYNRDFSDAQLNLSVGSSFGWDAIDPVADDDTFGGFATKTTLHANAVATRVISPTLLVRMGAELNLVSGLQHNPYRNVYAGGSRVPENHPDHRVRRDLFLKVNQYLLNRSSLKFNYRFYNDDWGITSHEIGTRLSQVITRAVFAGYEYRYYTQGEAYFYRDEYPTVNGIDGYMSGDYRMADLASHLFGFTFDVDLREWATETPVLGRTELRFNIERYFNSNNYSANILTTRAIYHF